MHSEEQSYREGVWFAVPIGESRFAVGLVARTSLQGTILFGYFFGPRRSTLPLLSNTQEYHPADAILVGRFDHLALRQRKWPVLGQAEPWDRSRWPIPVLSRYVDAVPGYHPALAWRVEYPDEDPNGVPHEIRIPVEEGKHLPSASLMSNQTIEIELTKLLGTDGEDAYSPATLRARPLFNQPTIDYFLYFPTLVIATKVARLLSSKGYAVEVRDSRALNAGWLTLAKRTLATSEEELDMVEAYMTELATAEGGEYDGYERDIHHS